MNFKLNFAHKFKIYRSASPGSNSICLRGGRPNQTTMTFLMVHSGESVKQLLDQGTFDYETLGKDIQSAVGIFKVNFKYFCTIMIFKIIWHSIIYLYCRDFFKLETCIKYIENFHLNTFYTLKIGVN